ncbi:MAG: hypothetical protein ABSA21_06000 [Candidatus Limnocylindrales bacterium]|jgi:hypothetical protein
MWRAWLAALRSRPLTVAIVVLLFVVILYLWVVSTQLSPMLP